MKTKVSRFAKVVCFLLAATLMVASLNSLFKPKWLENRWEPSKTASSFYDLRKNSTEVLFFGTSQVAASINPFQLYEEYGISAYNLGIMSQPIQATYFWLKEVTKTQQPKLAVIEVKAMARVGLKEEEKARKSFDYMKDNLNKLQYAFEYNKAQDSVSGKNEIYLWDYLFPLSAYHTRWSSLQQDDYEFCLGENKTNTRGFATLTTYYKDKSTYTTEDYLKGKYDGFVVKKDDKEDVHETIVDYDKKLLDYAKEQGIELLFIKTPDYRWSVKQHNFVKDLAEEYDIPFIDFNLKDMRNEIGFEFIDDEADEIHANIYGAQKVTGYVGKYLNENYELTDYRTTEGDVKNDLEEELVNYQLTMKDAKLSFERDFDTYLELINDEDYSFIIAGGSNVKNVPFTDAQKQILMNYGVGEELFKETDYGANFILARDSGKSEFKYEKQNSLFEKAIYLGGTFADGTDYSVNAAEKYSSYRFNDNGFTLVGTDCINIIVYNNRLHEVADSTYLYSNDEGNGVVMGRKEL